MSAMSEYLFHKYNRAVMNSEEVCIELGVSAEALNTLIKEKAILPLPGADMRFSVTGVSRYLEGGNEATTADTALTAPQAVDLSTVLTVEELAQVLKVGRNAAYKLVKDPRLGAVRVRNSWRIPGDCVKKYLAGVPDQSYHADGNEQSGPSLERSCESCM